MGHKTDPRRYAKRTEKGAEKREPPARKAISAARARSLVMRYLKGLEVGKQGYAEADQALEELAAGELLGSEIKLADGRTARLVDQFETKTKIWKPCAVSRFKIEVQPKSET
jgi:hypothetical protein